MGEETTQARRLLDKTNRQFNECNALYHTVAQRCGLSDATFWMLYALYTNAEPQTQNQIAAEWALPKQTLNSAVAAMVKKGLVELCPGKGRSKTILLTAEGQALAGRTVGVVIAAEQEAITAMGLQDAEAYCRLGQKHLECLRRAFEKRMSSPSGGPLDAIQK